MPKIHRFETTLWLPLPPEAVFPFFADAYNLETITPAFLQFHVVTPKPIEMRAGTLIDACESCGVILYADETIE